MRFVNFDLVTPQKTGEKDRLGNDITKDVVKRVAKGRFTEWSADDVSLYGRDLTSSARKLLTNQVSKEEAKQASHVVIDGSKYKVESIKDLGRWRLLVIKGYRL
ncbi:TPA: hypothetical protein TUW76_001092 [Streptococcus equi subsp. zooepidemicus]|uniref:Phage protein n=1 Tax=Streptococcus equi subsp. zooepidemicus TaxID=40041 RepID=A0A7Z8ZVF4_STRSZ|nr:hypothetical protein [Streptococcus equi]MCD3368943.1 hypothetical protein [Streptococcus equi subsp. zooepidemicus]QUQ79955.1 hypothetical protein LJFMMFNO_00960 [Streptococcus equi subsp. zooepidemicus]VEF06758.1 phage protein [Streptococcus equi subsp. zooepidemicus]VTS23138.1 phage protein [Streptococcus equi subsp. zooepidemicus]HEK9073970.1 hypothetical protein [Streptococcus equi subsp. zooepidemicus]